MTKSLLLKSASRVAITAAITLGSAGVAHAEKYVLEDGPAAFVANTTATEISNRTADRGQYDKLDILSNVLLVPSTRGAQGPMRSDTLEDEAHEYHGTPVMLDVLGNGFWQSSGSAY